ncbi:hypothetical protein C0993_006593 [Termitomyces sp. T159_Od127]|nr:hypothetical protein C0993_006593 [Termitomyces sp. T159_Od127]
MMFPSFSAYFAATYLHLQPTNNPTLNLSKARATGTSTTPPDNLEDTPPLWPSLGAPLTFAPNIPQNKYKGPDHPTQHLQMTLDTNNMNQTASLLNLEALNIKIIDSAPFAHILQGGTDTTTPEPKIEEQI